jgi:hypothetical protein
MGGGGRGPFLRVEVRVGAQVNFIIGMEATRNETEAITGFFFSFSQNEACQDAVRGASGAKLS